MQVRIKYRSVEDAKKAQSLLPVSCKSSIVTDKTTDAYLEVHESYYDYVMDYLNPDKL